MFSSGLSGVIEGVYLHAVLAKLSDRFAKRFRVILAHKDFITYSERG
jgi:hypothetical protein